MWQHRVKSAVWLSGYQSFVNICCPNHDNERIIVPAKFWCPLHDFITNTTAFLLQGPSTFSWNCVAEGSRFPYDKNTFDCINVAAVRSHRGAIYSEVSEIDEAPVYRLPSMFPCCHVQAAVHLFARPLKRRVVLKSAAVLPTGQWLMTVPQSSKNVLRAVVSATVNADERRSRNVRPPAEPARPCGRLKYAPHNDVSVNDGPHIRRWSHKIIIPLCYNCLQYSVQ